MTAHDPVNTLDIQHAATDDLPHVDADDVNQPIQPDQSVEVPTMPAGTPPLVREEIPATESDVPLTQPLPHPSSEEEPSVKTQRKPKHLRERWILTQTPSPQDQQQQQIAAAARHFMQACLEAFNLSDASIGGGGASPGPSSLCYL